jgi:hypothetical protein
VGFSGVVLTDRLQLQVLTESFPMETNVHESAIVMRAARAFGAFRIAFQELTTHYNNLSKVVPSNLGRQREVMFPYPNSFANGSGVPTMFTYLERPDPSKLIFIATVGHSKVFIKFTQRYSEDAHRHCAAAGVAPELYRVTLLPAGWFMVVMEYLEPTMYRTLEPQDRGSVGLITEVGRVVGVLHAGGFVHGDIRTINMMVHCEWGSSMEARKLLLLDFDWAGQEGEVKYPLDVDTQNILRHSEVRGGAGMMKKHDLFVVEHLFDSVPLSG